MRIYDAGSKRQLRGVSLLLTPAEARQLADSALALADDPSLHHAHVSDDEFGREIVVAVYTAENLSAFDAESRAVIEHGDDPDRMP